MKKLVVMLLLIAIVFLCLAPFTSARSLSVRVVVGVDGSRYAEARAVLKGLGSVELEIPEINAIVLSLPAEALQHLRSLPFVRYVEDDAPVRLLDEVQWNVEMINATDVWVGYESTYGDAAYGYSETVSVAVVDTGIDYAHNDLQGAVTWCVVSLRNLKTYYSGTNLKKCSDANGHGTHVAGIIASRLNGLGVAGVAPKVILYAIRVLDASGSGYVSDVAKGIVEAVKGPDGTPGTPDDADVISMSLGGPDSTTLHDAVQYAYSYNVTLVAAAGNEGADNPSYPAAYDEVIAVGAVDQSYQVPSWSNRNPTLTAPGVNILSTWPKNRYAYASGTSMACPHVSATVALIQSIRVAAGLRKLTPQEVEQVLTTTAVDLGDPGFDPYYGYGLVDAYGAVVNALST
jgi:subtilisin family serine protease